MEDTGGVTCRPDRPSNLSTQNEETESCRIIDGSEDRSPCVPRVDPREDRFDQAMEAALYVETKELKRRPKLKRMKLQFYKTKMCPWMAQGRCLRGLSCQYAHSEIELSPLPNLLKTRMCESLTLTGSCPRSASECKFAHSAEELRSTEIFARSKMCPLFLAGQCRANEKCRYAHSAQELRKASVASALFLQKHPCRQLQADASSVGAATVAPAGVKTTEDALLVETGAESTADDTGTIASPSSAVTAACSMNTEVPAKFTLRYPLAKSGMATPARSSTRRPHSGILLQRRIMPSVFLCSASAGGSVRKQSCSERDSGSFSHPGSPKGSVAPTSQVSSPQGSGRQIQAIARLYCASQPPPPPDLTPPPAVLPDRRETSVLSQPSATEECEGNKEGHPGTVTCSDESDSPSTDNALQKSGGRKGRDESGQSLSRRGTSCSSSRTSVSSLALSRENTVGQLGVCAMHAEIRGDRKVGEEQGEQGMSSCVLGTRGPPEEMVRGTAVNKSGVKVLSVSISEAPEGTENEDVFSPATDGEETAQRVPSPAGMWVARSSVAEGKPSGSVPPLALTPPSAKREHESVSPSGGELCSEAESSGQERMSKARWLEQQHTPHAGPNDKVPFQWHWRCVGARNRNRGPTSTVPSVWLVQDRSRRCHESAAPSNASAAAVSIGRRFGPEQGVDQYLSRRCENLQGSLRKHGTYPLATGSSPTSVRQHHPRQPAPTYVRPVFSALPSEQQQGHAWSFVQTGGYPGTSTPGSWTYQYEGFPGSTVYRCEQSLPSFPYVPDSRLVSPDSCMSRTSFSPQSSGSTVATPHGVPAAPYASPAGGSVLTACQSQVGGGCEITEQRISPAVHADSTLGPSRVILYGSPVDNATFYSGGCGVAAAFSGGMEGQRQLLYLPQSAVGQSMQSLPPEVLLPKVLTEVLKASEPDRYED